MHVEIYQDEYDIIYLPLMLPPCSIHLTSRDETLYGRTLSPEWMGSTPTQDTSTFARNGYSVGVD